MTRRQTQGSPQALAIAPSWDFLVSASSIDGESVPIMTVPLTRSIATRWHQDIQPTIREASKKEYRADHKWNWPRLLSLPYAAALSGQRCWGTALMVPGAGGIAVPAALSLLLEPVRPRELDSRQILLWEHESHLYAWFLAVAPKLAMDNLGAPHIVGVGGLGVDAAIVASGQRGMDGRLWLHAAECKGYPEAAARLFDFYRNKCGLTEVGDVSHSIQHAPTRLVRRNDGRHFRADKLVSRKLYTQKRKPVK